jgi:hypothetical protein
MAHDRHKRKHAFPPQPNRRWLTPTASPTSATSLCDPNLTPNLSPGPIDASLGPNGTPTAAPGFPQPMTHFSPRVGPVPSVPIDQAHYKPRRHDEPMTQRTAHQLEGATLASLETSVGLSYERIKRAQERMGPLALHLKRQKVDVDAYLAPGAETALRIMRKIDEGERVALGSVPRSVGLGIATRIPWDVLRKRVPGHGILPPVATRARPVHKTRPPPPPATPTIAQALGLGHGASWAKGVGTNNGHERTDATHHTPSRPLPTHTASNPKPTTTLFRGCGEGKKASEKPPEWVQPVAHSPV